MQETIKVHVVKYPDWENLVMRYRDPITGRHMMRSTKTTKRDQALKAAGAWQDELRNGHDKPPSM